ncbi:hypothetical protein LX36DRAFT_683330 [Colletotrichum falcatum]|nr:hypothetical protein LX36DRAFT_683330 [Colletotrichum falcatum]
MSINCQQIPGPLKPYGDIAGIGVGYLHPVVLGFVASAWLAIVVLVAYYIFAFNPHADPFSITDGQNDSKPYTPNPVDELVARYTRRLRTGRNFRGGLAEATFHKQDDYGALL